MTMINHRSHYLCKRIRIIAADVEVSLELLEGADHHGLEGEDLVGALLEPVLDPILLVLERVLEHLHLVEALAQTLSEF